MVWDLTCNQEESPVGNRWAPETGRRENRIETKRDEKGYGMLPVKCGSVVPRSQPGFVQVPTRQRTSCAEESAVSLPR